MDGNSTDGTVDEAKKCAAHAKKNDVKVVVKKNEERGRAKQFNRGGMESMMVSKRESARDVDEHILVFLHADTTMPETYTRIGDFGLSSTAPSGPTRADCASTLP